jgi:hypothetical protein
MDLEWMTQHVMMTELVLVLGLGYVRKIGKLPRLLLPAAAPAFSFVLLLVFPVFLGLPLVPSSISVVSETGSTAMFIGGIFPVLTAPAPSPGENGGMWQ